MGFRFKNRKLIYAELEYEHEKDEIPLNSEYIPVVILARITEQGLTGTKYAYRVADEHGHSALVWEEDALSEADYREKFPEEFEDDKGEPEKTEESTGQPENPV